MDNPFEPVRPKPVTTTTIFANGKASHSPDMAEILIPVTSREEAERIATGVSSIKWVLAVNHEYCLIGVPSTRFPDVLREIPANHVIKWTHSRSEENRVRGLASAKAVQSAQEVAAHQARELGYRVERIMDIRPVTHSASPCKHNDTNNTLEYSVDVVVVFSLVHEFR